MKHVRGICWNLAREEKTVQDNLHAHAHFESCLFVKRGISKSKKREANHSGKEENQKNLTYTKILTKDLDLGFGPAQAPFGWVRVRVGRSDH